MTPIQPISNTLPSYPLSSPWAMVDEALRKKGLENKFNKQGLTPLEAAIRLKDLDLCKKVLEQQGTLDPEKPFEQSLLMRAMCEGNESIPLWLFEQGIDIHQQDTHKGFNFLHQAAALGYTSVAKKLIEWGLHIDSPSHLPFPEVPENYPAELKTPTRLCTPLFFAVANDQRDMVRWLLRKGADANKGTTINIPFLEALVEDKKEILKIFIEEGYKIDAVRILEELLLHFMIQSNNEQNVKTLLELGANPNIPNKDNETPLHCAIDYNQLPMVKLLAEYRADLNAKNRSGRTPLYRVGPDNLDCMDLFRYLLEKGADPNLPDDQDQYTPLHSAAILHKEEYIELLLKYPVQVNVPDTKGETPLFKIANTKGKGEHLAALLLKNGADPQHSNHDQVTPLHRMATNGECLAAKLLLEKGALVNAVDKNGNTPLYYAEKEEMVELLLKNGANARVLNNQGVTPLIYVSCMPSFSDQKFQSLQKADGGLTLLVQNLKLLGHRFSLKGSWMEGFNSLITYREMAASLRNFIGTLPPELQINLQHLPTKFLEFATFKFDERTSFELAFHESQKTGALLALPLVWGGTHALTIAIQGPYVIRGNRGAGTEKPGITIFKMQDPEKAYAGLFKLIEVLYKKPNAKEILAEQKARNYKDSYETIKKEFEKKYKEDAIQFFNETLIETMGLTKIDDLTQKPQKSGNCSWMSAKMGFRAALILSFLQDNGDLPEALKKAKSLYSQWAKFDYEKALEKVPEILQEPLIKNQIEVDTLFWMLFQVCCRKKKSRWTKQLIESYPDMIHSKDPETGTTLIHLAKDIDTFESLINKGSDPFAADHEGYDAYKGALQDGNLPLVRFFIEKLGVKPTEAKDKSTPLEYAVHGDYSELAAYLLSKGVDPWEGSVLNLALDKKPEIVRLFTHYQDAKGRSLLFNEKAPSWSIEELIKAGTPLDIVDKEGNTFLLHMYKQGAIKTLNSLLFDLSRNSVVKSQDTNGNNLLHLIFKDGHNDNSDLLSTIIGRAKEQLPALLTAKNHAGQTPFCIADASGNNYLHLTLMEPTDSPCNSLLRSLRYVEGAKLPIEPLAQKNKLGLTPLHILLKQPFSSEIENFMSTLPDCSSLVCLEDSEGNNLLHLVALQAPSSCADDILKLLVKGNNAPLIQAFTKINQNGYTPLHLLYKHPIDYSIIRILREMLCLLTNCNLHSIVDSQGNNLLHPLAYHAANPLVQYLTSVIAEQIKEHFQTLLQAKNRAGQTPIDLWNQVVGTMNPPNQNPSNKT